jgi:hypothetical protein
VELRGLLKAGAREAEKPAEHDQLKRVILGAFKPAGSVVGWAPRLGGTKEGAPAAGHLSTRFS